MEFFELTPENCSFIYIDNSGVKLSVEWESGQPMVYIPISDESGTVKLRVNVMDIYSQVSRYGITIIKRVGHDG